MSGYGAALHRCRPVPRLPVIALSKAPAPDRALLEGERRGLRRVNSERQFGVERRTYKRADARKIDAIAEQNDCVHVRVNVPGDGPTAWFTTRDYGYTAGKLTEESVREAMESAGFWCPEE